ncbi:hypothetical protein ANN_12002, partial [Periplaneta americana]
LGDDLRPGQSHTVITEEVVAADNLIWADQMCTVEEVAQNINISHGSAYSIIHNRLKYCKVCTNWVPKCVTEGPLLCTSWREENLSLLLDTPKSSVLNCVAPSKTSDLDICVKVSFSYTTMHDHIQLGTPWSPFRTCTGIGHPPYSPDLSPCDFQIFGKLKSDLGGRRFAMDSDVIEAVQQWCHQQPKYL